MDALPKKETRAHRRISLIKEAQLSGAISSTIMDISEGGLFVYTLHYFSPDSVIEVTIPLEGEQMTLKAQVKYCHQGIGIGAAFHYSDNKQRTAIKEFIESITGKPD
jgi:hypothetical protein